MTLSAFGEIILELVQPQVARKTFSTYRYSFLKWIELMGDTDLEVLSPQSIELFKNRCFSSGLAPESVSIYFRALKSLFNRSIKMGILNGTNPFKEVSSIRIPSAPIEWITEEEHKKILKSIRGRGIMRTESLRKLYTFLFHTGLRSGEVLALKVEDVDLVNRTIVIRATKTNTLRGIPLNSIALHAIRREIEVNKLTSGRIWKYTVSGASHSFVDAKRRAGIEKDITFYNYRLFSKLSGWIYDNNVS